jgi:hypothetical protein
MNTHKFSEVANAIVAFDNARNAWLLAFDQDASWDTLNKLDLVEHVAIQNVKEAFAKATQDINSRDNAMLVHPRDAWLRRLCNIKETGE